MKPRPPLEKVVQAQIVKLLASVGGEVFVLGTRRPSGDYQGTRQTPGIADLYVILPDRAALRDLPPVQACALWVECKREGGRLSNQQERFRMLCLSAGIAHVVGGVNEVYAWLIRQGRLSPD